MSFTRKTLVSYGLDAEQVDKVSTLHSTSMTDYILKTEAKAQADAAVQEALKSAPQAINPTETDEYKALEQKYEKLKITSSKEFSSVNPKYSDFVFDKLEFGEGAAPIPDQLNAMRESMGELFVSDAQPAKNTPVYSQKPPKPSANSAEDAEVAKVLESW